MSCCGYVVTGAHPVYVGLHLHAVDLCEIGLIDIEGRVLADGEYHKLVGLHEVSNIVIQGGALDFGLSYLLRREIQPFFNVPYYGVL